MHITNTPIHLFVPRALMRNSLGRCMYIIIPVIIIAFYAKCLR